MTTPRLTAPARARLDAFRADCRAAWANLCAIFHERPQAVQFVSGLWPLLWGANALGVGDALWATAPGLYLWMHAGPLSGWSARGWGAASLLVGLWQWYALVWPVRDRPALMRRAARCLCAWNVAMAVGFGAASPANPAVKFYASQAAVSLWCVWRRAGAAPRDSALRAR